MWRHWYVVIQGADGEKLIGPYATRREATRIAERQSDRRPPGTVSVRLQERQHVAAVKPRGRF